MFSPVVAALAGYQFALSCVDLCHGSSNHIKCHCTVRLTFHAIASDYPIPADTLAWVGKALHDCCAKRCLSIEGAEVRWTWRPGARFTDCLLYPVLTAATGLLTSVSRGLVRQCEDAGCGWLFLDRSNARKRRWCSMADCGNRNKARTYYRREAG